MWAQIWGYAKYAAKALLSVVAVVIGCLLMILIDGETLADVTFVQWLFVASMVLGTFGFVFRVPNGEKPPARVPEA